MRLPAGSTNKAVRADAMDPGSASLSDQVYAQLEELLVTLELAPGQILSESELCARFQVSRTPVGEALQRLSRQGLVSILPRRGVIVTEVNALDHLKVLEIRREIARYCARSAARRAKPAQMQAMQAIAERLANASISGEPSELLRADKAFHDLFSQCVHNDFATRPLETLDALSRRFYFMHRELDDPRVSAKLHAALASAIAQADQSAASNACDALFDHLEQFTRATIDR
jgi:DNA-binding GntR family transcriptional regulator